MSDLKPCPFCGCEDIDEYEGNYGNGVYCMNCGAMMGEQIHREFYVHERVAYKQAAEAWNTRAAVTDHDFAMAVHDGELWGKCSECGDATELANVRMMLEDTLESNDQLRERIAELEAQLSQERMDHSVTWGDLAYEQDALRQRDELIRDLYRMINCACLTDKLECSSCKLVGEGIPCDLTKMHRRIRELGIEVDE